MMARQRPTTVATLLLLLCLLASASSVDAWDSSEDAKAMAKRAKHEQIQFWEREVNILRQGELTRAYNKLYQAEAALESARAKQGFFYTRPQDKATIRLLDEDYRRTLVEVKALKEQERLIMAKLKPLYGVVSLHFAQEQKRTISESIKTVQSLSYDNAWYSSLFSLGEAESFSDIIMGFIGNWVIGFVILYPFAVLYYALWAAPWSVYEYTAGAADLVPGAVAYAACVVVMCLPLIVLALTFYLLIRHYGPQLQAAAQQAQARRHQD
ncbi:protein of unknown function - conserved [Leishmania donovani]|uniref:Uncharacterized protein n=6 Tax=Leishmania donovani species complex TaxID=38574 RepID=A4I474_LEIIN|nr:conserved hypothetical protein [Leishmania infantum JPCM5]XP_003862439.1 hypothetical protein, conserved [Leishmania donovani]CAC9506776.1 hypothetical_protein_-_conserved [Leishmania infantum]AYU80507.1 hypothetical protein LdCL_290007000 [Leishmania donovani]CAJ1990491.1 protein of unknown function - conserved [Leishmania donovani]CAM69582.1 conserved hypothetical protein [Leishmania infantum JPCM5]CBZ35746.1 hypothetical protein, conserved [Leishmania donovani]|eukprot:XP_001466543.1 conserved hypothetical protein [Leishmania infantum JPCM5]